MIEIMVYVPRSKSFFFAKKHTVGLKTTKSRKIELTLHFCRTTIAVDGTFLEFTLVKHDKNPLYCKVCQSLGFFPIT